MSTNEPYERRELTEEDLQSGREALEQLHRDFAAAKNRPPAEIRNPGKFSEPLGMFPDGTFQRPLTDDEKRHNEEVRQRAHGEED
jgi:hypothetical protein